MPPGIERRSGGERRATEGVPPHGRGSRVLPEAWRNGWLVFEPEGDPSPDVRRLPDLPPDWQTCPVRRLQDYLARAAARRRAT